MLPNLLNTTVLPYQRLLLLQELCARLPDGSRIVINCSGRGDKDVNTAMKLMQGISQDEPQQ